MKAHPNEQLKLLELARIDAGFARLQHLASNLPEQQHLVSIEQDRRSRRAAAASALGELEDLQTQLARVQDDIVKAGQRRAHDEATMLASSDTKVIAGLQREIDSLERREARLRDDADALTAAVADATTSYETARDTMRELEDLASDLLERRELAKRNLQIEAKTLRDDRKALVSGIDAELLKLYDDRRKRTGIGAAELVGNVSSASNEVIETADMVRMRSLAADDVTFCPHTGTVLIRTDRSDV
ncbi:zinc ribbon domain-containing protein [Gulosibacter bifidus]|uniref:Zinc ribbon domain-containing protein n=1 Tax=Gulosibacter bifidus TaxID=272239 RepID=A0ABW5RFV2_9MICO|nr:hypothetical protein [Gulosibacter bifidus]